MTDYSYLTGARASREGAKQFILLAFLCLISLTGLLAGCAPVPPPKPAEAGVLADNSTPIGPGWFEDRAAQAGVAFALGHSGKTPLTVLETMGTGCAVCDFNDDGYADLFFVGQTGTESQGRCALYRNNKDGTFTDVTAGSGLEQPGMYMGCAVADMDNDGKADLLVTGYGIIKLYRNLGNFKFADVTNGSGLEAPSTTSWASSAGFADIDHDGLVDVFIGHYIKFDDKTLQFCDYNGLKSSCGPNFYDAQLGTLYKNTGHFKFKDVTRQFGLDKAHGKCLGVVFADFNGDGWPDLYLGNDEMPGDLFINEGGKGFRNDGLKNGVALSSDGTFQGAMGVDSADYNGDGLMDLFVTTFEFEPDSLYANSAQGLFINDSLSKGIEQGTRTKVGFGVKFADFNNAGVLDLAIANGHIHDNQELIDKFSNYRQPMQLYMQESNSFIDRSREAGTGFLTPGVGRGLAVGDLENNGRLDVVLVDLEGRARLLMNKMPDMGNWIRIHLVGTTSNRMGLGSWITVKAGKKTWVAEASTGGSYLSASDPRVHIGLGKRTSVDSIEVKWPSGKTSRITNPHIPGDIEIKEP